MLKEQEREHEKSHYILDMKRIEYRKVFEQIVNQKQTLSMRQRLKLLINKLVYKGKVPYPEGFKRYDFFVCRLCWDIT